MRNSFMNGKLIVCDDTATGEEKFRKFREQMFKKEVCGDIFGMSCEERGD
jgi:hypothetical protein